MPSVLITGAARGIGRATARRLAASGWDVIAGVRGADDAGELERESPRITPVILDITDEAQVAALDAHLPERLDAVVNNAGIVVGGPVEGVRREDLLRQFDVNVAGQVAVTQAVLPRLRSSHGRVLFISSVSGRVATPLMGPYTASKFALEAMADALRVELRPWGVAVVLIEPGTIDTDIWRQAEQTVDRTEAALSPEQRALYAGHVATFRRAVPKIRRNASRPEKVADAIERALTAERPSARYLVGADARAQVVLQALLPTRLWDAALARLVTSGRR
jgi:NAD(P)-dependent dehydrogenase (short-subunit alcohol dehydrogenase family)